MALANYSDLKNAVANALHRSDLASVIPDFITLAEDKLNKRLRLRAMENRVTASVSSEYVSLPDGFLAIKNIQLNTVPRTPLVYATSEILDMRYPDNTSTRTPHFYTFAAGQIQLAPVPDTTYTLELDYYKKLDLATDSTNWVMTNAPRCYYYGALLEAAQYTKDNARAAQWEGLLEKAISEVEDADDLDLFSDAAPFIISDSFPGR